MGAMLAIMTSACATGPISFKKPLIIAHRGASGYLPEHTLAAYDLAIDLGAEYIEVDLVVTKDGILVARHENEISGTTNVAEVFPDRRTTKVIDGTEITGWFTEDFTLEELRTLRARERMPNRSQAQNDQHQIPTFDEIIRLVISRGIELGRPIGLYPETKHPTYFTSIGLPMEERLVETLDRFGLNRKEAPIYIQSFEVWNLQVLRNLVDVPLVQLMLDANERPFDFVIAGDSRTYGDLMTENGLKEIARYAAAIGPWKESLRKDRELVNRAHAQGLQVHAYTFRSDPDILPARFEGNPEREYVEYFEMGVDGVFTDFPDHALSARAKWGK